MVAYVSPVVMVDQVVDVQQVFTVPIVKPDSDVNLDSQVDHHVSTVVFAAM